MMDGLSDGDQMATGAMVIFSFLLLAFMGAGVVQEIRDRRKRRRRETRR